MKILLIKEEAKLTQAVLYLLKKNGYAVDSATDSETGIEMAATGVYDAIVLESRLKERDSIAIIKEYRAMGFDTPLLLLTAKNDPRERIAGLDAGADTCLEKPFLGEELLARIRALIRRQSTTVEDNTITVADFILDPLQGRVTRGEEQIQLTVKEAQLLELLMLNYGQVIPTTRILEKIWGCESIENVPYVHLYIHYLRKKLKFIYIRTVYEVGYCLQKKKELTIANSQALNKAINV